MDRTPANPPGPTLVLGAGGFLGAWIVRAAARAVPGPLVGAGRRAPQGRAAPPAGVRFTPLDLECGGALEELLGALRPARVLLAAALSKVADCERAPARARLLNVEVPARAAAWCAAHGARLVHVSTDLVFGARPAPPGGFGERDEVGPLSVYGATKAEGEAAALAADPAALVVRLPLLFGDSLGRGLGATDAVCAAVARGERPRLFADEWRTPLDVGDAATALVELARRAERGVLHVAGPERRSRLALGLAGLVAAGLSPDEARLRVAPARRAEHGDGPRRAEDTSLDAARARALLATRLRGPGEALGGGRA